MSAVSRDTCRSPAAGRLRPATHPRTLERVPNARVGGVKHGRERAWFDAGRRASFQPPHQRTNLMHEAARVHQLCVQLVRVRPRFQVSGRLHYGRLNGDRWRLWSGASHSSFRHLRPSAQPRFSVCRKACARCKRCAAWQTPRGLLRGVTPREKRRFGLLRHAGGYPQPADSAGFTRNGAEEIRTPDP